MLEALLPLQIHLDAVLLTSAGLWSLALYLGLPSISNWLMDLFVRGFDRVERSLSRSQEKFEKTRPERDAQNALYAAIFSILPFLSAGFLIHMILLPLLDTAWMIGLAIVACLGSGAYEFQRQNRPSN